MTTNKPTNIAASVRQRLLNKARKDQRPFAELLQYFAMERFLYRLSQSPHADKFGQNKSQQWLAFRKRLGSEESPEEFLEIMTFIRQFLGPVINDLQSEQHGTGIWPASGPWKNHER